MPCRVDSDCPGDTCNGNKISCSDKKCGAAKCTGVAAGASPGTVECGVLCRCTNASKTCTAPSRVPAQAPVAYGQVTLRARHIDGCNKELLVNANTKGGSVAIELLDLMGFRVRGFGANGGPDPTVGGHEAVPITRVDTLNASTRWRAPNASSSGEGYGLGKLDAGMYMVRAYLSGGAALYSGSFVGCSV